MTNSNNYTSGFYFAFFTAYMTLGILSLCGWTVLEGYGWLMLSISAILLSISRIMHTNLELISESWILLNKGDIGEGYERPWSQNNELCKKIAKSQTIRERKVEKYFGEIERAAIGQKYYLFKNSVRWCSFVFGVVCLLLAGYFVLNDGRLCPVPGQLNGAFSLFSIAMMFLSYLFQNFYAEKHNNINMLRGYFGDIKKQEKGAD